MAQTMKWLKPRPQSGPDRLIGSKVARQRRPEQGRGKRFRGGLVCKDHRLVYHSTLGLRVITKKRRSDLEEEHGHETDSSLDGWGHPEGHHLAHTKHPPP